MPEKDITHTHSVLKDQGLPSEKEIYVDLKAFFRDDLRLLFAFKKSQKLASAVYLVTNFMSEGERLRLDLRELSVSLVKNILEFVSFKGALPSKLILEIISLLEIASSAELLSLMNMQVLRRSYQEVWSVFAEEERPASVPLQEDLLRVEMPLESKPKSEGVRGSSGGSLSAGFDLLGLNRTMSDQEVLIKDSRKGQSKGHNYQSLPQRSEVIIGVIKDSRGALSIKDIAKHMRQIGEKTIQRELGSLVAKGVLKKEGQRRWSRYSLRAYTSA